METIYNFDDFVDMIRRRSRVILLVTLVGCLASFLLAISRSHLYQSAEVLQVSQPKVDDTIAPSSSGGSSARQLQLIQQQLMARSTLLDVARKFNLFAGRRPSEKVILLREAIQIEGVAAAREGFADDGTVSVLTISATMGDPTKAQELAHEFAQRTIAMNSAARTAKTRETLVFFANEESKLVAELDALEQELTAFRRENNLAIEGNLEFRQSQFASINSSILEVEREKIKLQRELEQLDQTQRAATLERKTRELESEIEILNDQRTLLEERANQLNKSIETTPRIESALNAFDRRREKLQNQLDVVAARRAEAEVAFKLEEQRQTARLRVIEPAVAPEVPITPSRKKMAIMGSVGSLILGVALAFLLDLRRPVIRNSAQMKARLGLTPVVTIPEMDTCQENLGWRARLWATLSLSLRALRLSGRERKSS